MSDILILLPTINSAWDSAMKKYLPSSSFYPFFWRVESISLATLKPDYSKIC